MGCGYSCINKFSDGKDIIPGSDHMPDMGFATFVLYSYVENDLLELFPSALRGIKCGTITYYGPEKTPILALIPKDKSIRILLLGIMADYPHIPGLKKSDDSIEGNRCVEYLFKDVDFRYAVRRLMEVAISNAGYEVRVKEPSDIWFQVDPPKDPPTRLPRLGTAAEQLFTSVRNGLRRILPEAFFEVEDEEITYYTSERRPILTIIPNDDALVMLLPGTMDRYPDIEGLRESGRRFGKWLEYIYSDMEYETAMLLLVSIAIINAK